MIRSAQTRTGTTNTVVVQLADMLAETVADAMDQAGLALTLTNTIALTAALGKALERVGCERERTVRQCRIERRSEWVQGLGLLPAADTARRLGLTPRELETAEELGIIAPVEVPLDLRATSDHFTRESWRYYPPDSALTDDDRARIAHGTLLTRTQAADRLGMPLTTFDHLRIERGLLPVAQPGGHGGSGGSQPNLYRTDDIDTLRPIATARQQDATHNRKAAR